MTTLNQATKTQNVPKSFYENEIFLLLDQLQRHFLRSSLKRKRNFKYRQMTPEIIGKFYYQSYLTDTIVKKLETVMGLYTRHVLSGISTIFTSKSSLLNFRTTIIYIRYKYKVKRSRFECISGGFSYNTFSVRRNRILKFVNFPF